MELKPSFIQKKKSGDLFNRLDQPLSGDQYSILVLDDEYEQGEMIKSFLEMLRRFEVDYVNEPALFWKKLERKSYDIAFLDYQLKVTTGLDVLEEMRRKGNQLPVIMMTGEGNERVAAQSIQLGAAEYLIKGEYQLQALPSLIEKIVHVARLKRAIELTNEQIRFQSLLLDNMRDAVVVWNTAGEITFWNTAAENLYGFTASEKIGLPVNDNYFSLFTPPLEAPAGVGMNGIKAERSYTRQNGEQVWISSRVSCLYKANDINYPIGFMDVARDITKQKLEQISLRQHEHFIQKIIDTSPNFLFVVDLKTNRVIFTNPEVKFILGYTPEEILKQKNGFILEICHPEDLPKLNEHFTAIAIQQNKRANEIECRLRHKDGSYHWLSSRFTIFAKDPSGRPSQVLGIALDITKRKKAEEQLYHRLNAEELLASISSSLVSISREEISKTILAALEKIGAFVGADRADIFLLDESQNLILDEYQWFRDGRPEESFLPVPLHEITWLVQELQQGKNIFIQESETILMKAATNINQLPYQGMRSFVFVPMFSHRSLIGFTGLGAKRSLNIRTGDLKILRTTAEAISNALAHQREEAALYESETRYRAIVEDHQEELICRFNAAHQFSFLNEAFCGFYKINRDEYLSRNFFELIPEEDRQKYLDVISGLNIDQETQMVEQMYVGQDGEKSWLDWIIRAIFDSKGQAVEYQAVGREVTERKKLEEKIQLTQTNLAQSMRLAAVGELASSVAHQIYNPLTTIIAESQLLRHLTPKDEPAYESIQAIETAGWRAQEVVQKLMAFSQPRENTDQPIFVNQTIKEAFHLTSAKYGYDHGQIHLSLTDDLPPISGNENQVVDVWVNLLLWMFPSHTGTQHFTITISSFLDAQGRVAVEILDDRIFLPEDALARIFEPQLLPPSTGQLSGMELSICRELVRQLNGEITVGCSENGISFHITFPPKGVNYGQ